MASFRKRDSGQWQAQVRKKGYPTQSKSFTTRAAAAQWVRSIEYEMDQGVFVSRNEAETTTLGELLDRYLIEYTADKKGAVSEACQIRKLLRHPLAKRFVASIRGVDMARDRRLQDAENGSGSEESRLFAACRHCRNPYLLPIVRFALETAMRRGEIVSLRWQHVNMTRRTVFLPDTKNGHPRTVPLSSVAIEILKALPRSISGEVFPGVTAGSIQQAFVRATCRAEIEDLHFHDLRHEATTRLFELGLNVIEVSSITGHKDLQMLRRYTHLRAEDLAKKLM